jgi:transposase
MARYKLIDRSPKFIPVVLDAQLIAGSFEYALDYLIDHELDLSRFDAHYNNDDTGAPAYAPSILLKIILLAYSRGTVSSRVIERACRENVLFMAISGDSAPQFTTIAKFVRELSTEINHLFTQVLLTCDAQGLIGHQMFAIDGVKLPSNASKHRSGTHAELAHDAERMEQAVSTLLKAHQARDSQSDGMNEDQERQQIFAVSTNINKKPSAYATLLPPTQSAKTPKARNSKAMSLTMTALNGHCQRRDPRLHCHCCGR